VQRTQEIGVRMALGARSGDVMSLIMSETMRPGSFGTGGRVRIGGHRVALDGLIFIWAERTGPAGVLGGVGISGRCGSAGWVFSGALRATRVDPMIALRYE
jgi:putative ABC transport system permease protein